VTCGKEDLDIRETMTVVIRRNRDCLNISISLYLRKRTMLVHTHILVDHP
jgi:hypothetical protein